MVDAIETTHYGYACVYRLPVGTAPVLVQAGTIGLASRGADVPAVPAHTPDACWVGGGQETESFTAAKL